MAGIIPFGLVANHRSSDQPQLLVRIAQRGGGFDRVGAGHRQVEPLARQDFGHRHNLQPVALAVEQRTKSIVVVGCEGVRRPGDGRVWRSQADLRSDAVNQFAVVGNERDGNLGIIQIATTAPFPIEQPLRE